MWWFQSRVVSWRLALLKLSFGRVGARAMRRFLCFWRRVFRPGECGCLPGYKPVGKLHTAATVGDLDEIQRLLTLDKYHVSQTDRKKRTPLHFASAYGHPEVAKFLIGRHCNINAPDRDGCTPLIKAAQHQQEECVNILLQNGANPSAADATLNTALHYAVDNDSPAVVATLIQYKANLDFKNKDGLTPFLASVEKSKVQVTKLLWKAHINMSDGCQRLSSKPDATDSPLTSPLTTKESEAEAKQKILSSVKKKEELSSLESLARDIFEEIINYSGPRRKWPGSLFANRGQLPGHTEENESQMECFTSWDRYGINFQRKKKDQENVHNSNSGILRTKSLILLEPEKNGLEVFLRTGLNFQISQM